VRLGGRCIVVGVTGGIASYKTADLVRLLVQRDATVRVVMTRGAQTFVTPLTFQTLSGTPVSTDTFSLTQESEIGHIRLADEADLVVVAPASANVLGKLAGGLADDLLTTVLTATRAPVLLAPAMNVNMYSNAVVQENLRRLAAAGYHLVGPEAGPLACGYSGLGRMSEPPVILEEVLRLLSPQDLAGERVLVTAGPNREPLDPMRFLSNRSTGRMGYAIARVARRRGAEVTLVSGPVDLPDPPGIRTVRVVSALEMQHAVTEAYPRASIVVMAAAVADYRPERVAAEKIRKESGPLTLRLVRNPDILQGLGRRKGRRLLIGFAAETGDLEARALRKLRSKNLDLIVANDVSATDAGFAVDTNRVELLDRTGRREQLPLLSKEEVAGRLCDWISAHRSASGPSARRRRARRR
jgi:phosphopantothenoylcysteine decarboxylase/phosphopantothenate--cysteine ligase